MLIYLMKLALYYLFNSNIYIYIIKLTNIQFLLTNLFNIYDKPKKKITRNKEPILKPILKVDGSKLLF